MKKNKNKKGKSIKRKKKLKYVNKKLNYYF